MGRIPDGGVLDSLKVKVTRPPKAGGAGCAAEMIKYLACVDKLGDESKCASAKRALEECMASVQALRDADPHKKRLKPPINYYLRQFVNQMKRR